jgi:plastocyanin domain-containing protein
MSINGSEWLVIVAGAGAILLVNWYFFVAGRTPVVATAAGANAAGQVIVVDGGYSPALLRAKVGKPLRLVFDRRDKGACSDEVVFPDFGLRRFLPTGEKTTIEITPPKAGRYDFTCGMSMHRGAIIAED